MNNDMQVIGVDVGSGFVKSATLDGRRFLSPSYVAPRPADLANDFAGQSHDGVVRYNGNEWLTGATAEASARHSLCNTRSDDWAGSDGWIVLLLRAIFDAGYTSGKVHLVVGVPQKSWTTALREDIVRKLVKRHTAHIDGQYLDIEVVPANSMVLPQAYGGLSWLIDHDERASEMSRDGVMIAGVDPGTYTTGFVTMRDNNYIRDLSGGAHNVGVWQVAEILRKIIDETHGWEPTPDQAMRAIRSPSKVFFKGENHDIHPLVGRAVAQVASGLTDRLSSAWGKSAAGMEILVYGGGADLFLPFIKAVFPQARMPIINSGETVIYPQFVPVIGMLVFFATRNGLLE